MESCAGPLANDLESLEMFMAAVLGARPATYDCTVLDVPWRRVAYHPGQKLRLGIVPEDPCFPLHPALRRGLADVIDKLEVDGHQLVRLAPEDCRISEMNEVAWALFDLDDTASRLVAKAGEPPIPSRRRIQTERQKLIGTCMPDFGASTGLDRLAILINKRAELTASWHKLMNQHGLDAVISPAAQTTAVEHDLFGIPPYTSFLNLLDVRGSRFAFHSYR